MRITVAGWSGRCWECQCRYRAGEVLILEDDAAYHMDCFRTRGTLELRPYEDTQPRELDRLLAVIQAEELLTGRPA